MNEKQALAMAFSLVFIPIGVVVAILSNEYVVAFIGFFSWLGLMAVSTHVKDK